MVYIWVWNIFVFLLYGYDKLAAVKKKRRVPENPGNSLFLYVCAVFLENGQAKIYKKKVFPKRSILW